MKDENGKAFGDGSAATSWRQMKEVFLQALDEAESDRPDFLDRSCADDPTLRREVEDLLGAHFESESFIETPVFNIGAVFALAESPAPISKRIGNYKIVREIGAGGMGAVFLAERSDGEFRQQVAVKIVRQNIADSQLISRFKRERQILASLNHPFIAKLIDGSVTADGTPFLVMEYVDGVPVTEYAGENRLDIKARLRLFLKICRAVAYAHRNLIVHRDLKPSNIFVTTDGDPKLLDFGLAKLTEENSGDDDEAAKTVTAARAMTPAYASPEQLRGEPMTTATDVYSLGVVLYELLTGARPFQFKNQSLDEAVRLVCRAAPPRPSIVQSSKFKIQDSKSESGKRKTSPKSKIQNLKSLRGDLDNIVLTALRKEPERRYSSVEQFAGDIERYLNGLPVQARKGNFTYRAGKFIRRNLVAAVAAALVLLFLTGGLTVSLWQYRNAERQRSKAEKINSFLERMISSANPSAKSNADPNASVEFAAVLDEAERQIETEDFASEPAIKANLQQIIGSNYLSIGKYDAAERNLQAAFAVQNKLLGENHPETLKTLVGLGQLAVIRSDYATSDSIYPHLLENLRREYNKGNIDVSFLLGALNDLALARRARGDSKQAETLLREAVAYKPEANDFAVKQIEITEAVLTLTLADQGKFDEAQSRVQNQIAEFKKASNRETAEICAALTILGSIEMEKGETDSAGESLRQAEKIYRKIFDPDYLPIHDNLRLQAQNLYLQGNFAEAEKTINQVLENYRQNASPKYINYATALTIKGLILNKQGRADEAERILREAVRLRDENLPKEHFMSALTAGALGEVLTSQKRFAEAEPLLLESYKNLQLSQAAENPRTELAKRRLTELYMAWEKPDALAGAR